jgi:hypothetical protein
MRIRFVLLALLTCGISLSARADPAGALALGKQATQLSHQGNHRGAIQLLEKAYAADPIEDYLLRQGAEYEAILAVQKEARDVRLATVCYEQALVLERNSAEQKSIREHLAVLRDELSIARTEAPRRITAAEAPQPPAPHLVEISFIASSSDDEFTVGIALHSCATPCSLRLAPGWYTLSVRGADSWHLDLEIPNEDGIVRLPSSRQAYLAPGVVLTIIGPAVAGSLWLLGATCPSATQENCELGSLIAWPLAGAAMFATGIGLLAYRGGRTPDHVEVERIGPTTPAPALRLSSIGFQPVHNGVVTGLTFHF